MPATTNQLQDGSRDLMTVVEIARDAGVSVCTAHDWLRFHHYMHFGLLLGQPIVHRDEYARFRREHPELVRPDNVPAAA